MCLTRSSHLICACLVDFVQFLPGANFRTADAFPVGREATTGNASAVRRLTTEQIIVLFTGGAV